GISTGGIGPGDVGVSGFSNISAGVYGYTNNPYAVGVLARSANFDPTNAGLGVVGTSDLNGIVSMPQFSVGGTATLCRNASAQIGYCSSSLRYKTDVQRFSGGLDIVNRLRP